jgi:mRNA-degrading endonuclease toxin of MazEF toxin-antitoxin module
MASELPHAGEIWITQFENAYPHEPAAIRPSIIIAPANQFDHAFVSSVVIPFTTTFHNFKFCYEVLPTLENGLRARSYAQCDQVRAINKDRFIEKLGIIEIDHWQTIRELVRQFLNL